MQERGSIWDTTALSGITSYRRVTVKKKGSEKDACKRLMETEERHIDSLSSCLADVFQKSAAQN